MPGQHSVDDGGRYLTLKFLSQGGAQRRYHPNASGRSFLDPRRKKILLLLDNSLRHVSRPPQPAFGSSARGPSVELSRNRFCQRAADARLTPSMAAVCSSVIPNVAGNKMD